MIMIEKRTFGPFPHGVRGTFTRADLEVYGINTLRPTFTCHVFFNDPEVAGPEIPMERESYAGHFSVFGHPECVGDDGHCKIEDRFRRFDDRPTSPLTPAFRRVVVTDALRRCVPASGSLTVTILTVADADETQIHGRFLLDCRGIQVTTFR
jgi:hypothetical protein